MKLKGSAILVSLLLGLFLSIILISVMLSSNSKISKMLTSSAQGQAYFAAFSGIEDGKVLYEKNKEDKKNLFELNEREEVFESNGRKAYYNILFEMSSLSFGKNFNSSAWYGNSQKAISDDALQVEGDGELKVDLTYLFSKPALFRPTKITIYFSDPFSQNQQGFLEENANSSAASGVSYSLQKNGGDVSSQDVSSSQVHQLSVNSIAECIKESCVLNIRFNTSNENSKYFFVKIKAQSASRIILPTRDIPGTIYLKSTGYFSLGKVELIQKINSDGEFLSLEKNGVYCDLSCKKEK
ncbi:MAG: hypothetical protein ABH810_02850 [bacterium]